MSKNSHNPSIDESQKDWSKTFRRTGVNMHGQTWEDIFDSFPTEAQQREAFEACVALACSKRWISTCNALNEDGFDPSVNWVRLLANWQKEAR